ncbi:guanylin-like [Trachemys scripta elegans]|uniref:guanylin-like n=1 Tax=Trachemys scripta elegans TaxID=31138 RepID=UPI0015545F56|nr:guanylin-like [Trachemys scripta elegans]
MKGITFPVTVMLLILVHSSQPVHVQEGEFSFPLEAVKKLKEFLDADVRASPRMTARTSFISVCANPELPKEFQPVCQREDAPIIFNRLNLAVQDMDICEICANAACAGCR